MRKDWEYKKLKDICSFVGDGDWIESKDQSNAGLRLIQTGNIGNGIFHDKAEKAKYISESTFIELSCTEIFHGDCLLSRLPDPIGRSCILPQLNERAITAVDCTILRFTNKIYPTFFVYYTLSTPYAISIISKTTGSTRKRISRKNLEGILIPIPPKPTQLAIVAELDKINELIQLKKQQLKDYDQLAQSIFYEMFGDPVENEKGWEVKKLGDLCTIFAGGDKPNDTRQFLDEEYKYPVIANGDGNKGVLGYTKNCKVKEDAVTIGARGASIGNCRIVKNGFTPAVRLLTLIPGAFLNCSYLFYIVKGLDYKQNGAGQAQLTVPNR